MPKAPDAAPVTVEIREAACHAWKSLGFLHAGQRERIMSGSEDNHPYVQTFARLATKSSDRALGDVQVTQEDTEAAEAWLDQWDMFASSVCRHDLAKLLSKIRQAAEQRALAAERREGEWKNKVAEWERTAREIEAEKMTAEKERDEARTKADKFLADATTVGRSAMQHMDRAIAAETALAASEQRVRALVEERSDMFWDADDPERPWDSPSEWAEEVWPIESKPFVTRFQHAIRQPDIWVMFTPPTEEDGEWETHEFNTEVEARTALLPAADGESGKQG